MRDVETLRSLPGEWIDRRGQPRPRFTVHRIVVLKPDHIGDLLIVDGAFALLQQFFPRARIEIICGRWNEKLAKRLGRFHAVHAVDLFHELSGRQSDLSIAEEVRRRGIETLRGMQLGAYDLALDLRYDVDSRPILRNIDARVYAGFGRGSEFPFLDVVLPRHEAVGAEAPEEMAILGRYFGPRVPGSSVVAAAVRGGGVFSSKPKSVMLDFEIVGAATPRECGTAQDDRRLGIGLERVEAVPLDGEGSPIGAGIILAPSFGTGWGSTESWGTWTIADRASLSVPAPNDSAARWLRCRLSMRSHVNSANPAIRCTIGTPGAEQRVDIDFDVASPTATFDLNLPLGLKAVELASPPFDLAPGHYSGLMRMFLARSPLRPAHVDFRLRALTGHAELVHHSVSILPGQRGLINVPFSCTVDTAGERLSFEISTEHAAEIEGARIEQVSFSAIERFNLVKPVAHMADWASLLVLRVAQIFSEEPPFGLAAPHRRSALAERPEGSPVPEALDGIEGRIAAWKRNGMAVIGIALGCNSEIRKWPPAYFSELIELILAVPDTKVVFIGGPIDKAEAESTCAQFGLDPMLHSLCGATGLDWLGVLLKTLDLFIGNNTGTTHFAGKVGVRTIGIYAGTNHPLEWGPIGENATWIYRNEDCAPCHLTDLSMCQHAHRCMINMLPSTVFETVRPEIEAIWSRRQAADPNEAGAERVDHPEAPLPAAERDDATSAARKTFTRVDDEQPSSGTGLGTPLANVSPSLSWQVNEPGTFAGAEMGDGAFGEPFRTGQAGSAVAVAAGAESSAVLEIDGSVEHCRAMLRLNPEDHQGIRYVLAASLLKADDIQGLADLLEAYDDDATAWHYTRALAALHEGSADSAECRRLTERAVRANRHVPDLLSGHVRPKPSLVDFPPIGSFDEAAQYNEQFGFAWRELPGAIGALYRAVVRTEAGSGRPGEAGEAGFPGRVERGVRAR